MRYYRAITLTYSPDGGPHNMQIAQQNQLLQQQQARMLAGRAMMQQFGGNGMPGGMPNGMGQMNAAQYQAMRSGPNMRPQVALPQHLQQQQQQAQLGAIAQEQQQVILLSNAIVLSLLTKNSINRCWQLSR